MRRQLSTERIAEVLSQISTTNLRWLLIRYIESDNEYHDAAVVAVNNEMEGGIRNELSRRGVDPDAVITRHLLSK